MEPGLKEEHIQAYFRVRRTWRMEMTSEECSGFRGMYMRRWQYIKVVVGVMQTRQELTSHYRCVTTNKLLFKVIEVRGPSARTASRGSLGRARSKIYT